MKTPFAFLAPAGRHARIRLAGVALFFTAGAVARAEVKLPAIFGDHMVLQQDAELPVWGWAAPGEHIEVTLGPRRAQTTAAADGSWRVNLEPVRTTTQPLTLTVAGKNTVTCNDVLVGDVWLASGQSNMELSLNGAHTAREDIPLANFPQIRFFRVPRTNRLEPQANVEAKWEVCSPQTAPGNSAVAYYFARELHQSQKRPIGIVASYWGGTPVQSWISLPALEKPPAFGSHVQQFRRQQETYVKTKDALPQLLKDYQTARDAWNAEVKPAYDAALKTWQTAAAQAKAAGRPEPARPTPSRPAPREPGNPLGAPNVPSSLFNGMIVPLIPYALKGAIWYQGESNANNPASGREYAQLFPRMIGDWRERWGQGAFPFLFVQLANFVPDKKNPDGQTWAWLRESQRLTLALPATGMASAVDIGNPADIHPKNKRDVGLRLAQAAKAVAYGQAVPPSGPLYESMKAEGGKVRIQFKSTGGGLVVGNPPWTPDGQPLPAPAGLTGFEIAGADRKWVSAEARIDGVSVLVLSPQVAAPVAVRYGWADNPRLHLYNREGLPASPFRTDDWN